MQDALPLQKPALGSSCNGCGYCCVQEPCQLAQEFLFCTKGPCVALEIEGGQSRCGLVRNPLGYMFFAQSPDRDFTQAREPAPALEAGRLLSIRIANALGIGKGCDADDDVDSEQWNRARPLDVPAAEK